MGILISAFGSRFEADYKHIQLLLYGISAITIYLANGMVLIAIREYIKVPSILELAETFTVVINYTFIFIAVYIFALFIKQLSDYLQNKVKK